MMATRSMASTGGSEAAATPDGSPVTCSPAPRLVAGALVIPPFQASFLGQDFVHWEEMRIELAELAPDRYRIVVVQNFWTEDPNPDLSQCLAGIFLSPDLRAMRSAASPTCFMPGLTARARM